MSKTVLDAQGKPLAKGWSGQPVWDLAMRLAEGIPPGKLLDAPSGGGYLAAQLAERGFTVAGTDILAELWQFPQYPFCAADMDRPLPFRDGAFDAILHVGALAHMENQTAIMRELQRLLRPGGHLVVTVENVFTLESRFRFLFSGTYRWYPHYKYRGETKKELFLYNREPIRLTTLIFLLERLGFEIEAVEFGGKKTPPFLLPLGWLFRALTSLHNAIRKDKTKATPTVVNSNAAFLYRHVGIRARKK
jgi:SAM-dependent methyltransferase